MRSLVAVTFLVATLGCMCGGTDPSSPDIAPASTAASGGWPATIAGVCQMEADCGCLEKASVSECSASLSVNAAALTSDVLSCIVSQSCAAMCNGGGSACIQGGAQRQMGAEAQRHQTVMGVMKNYPSGNPCPEGSTMVTDPQGRFVRCQ